MSSDTTPPAAPDGYDALVTRLAASETAIASLRDEARSAAAKANMTAVFARQEAHAGDLNERAAQRERDAWRAAVLRAFETFGQAPPEADDPSAECAEICGSALVSLVRAVRGAREGRSVAPTNDEIATHAAAGGAWLVRAEWRTGRQSIDFVQSWAPQIAGLLRDKCNATWWMALDSTHMPCAWPLVAGGSDAIL